MQCLIVLALAVAAHAQSFLPQDTAEVEAAKAAHFAEHARAAALVGAPLQDVYRTGFSHHFAAPFAPAPVVTPQGFLADTPEVAAARAAHLAEHARLTHHYQADPYTEYYRAYYSRYYPNHGYHGPQAMPTVLPSGYLADTPEVAHARATHLYRHYQESTRQNSFK